ncbi:hypothetical protein ScPMuIL_005896 [Solemya velum]
MTIELEEYMTNPIHTFHLLHRAVKGWDRMRDILSCEGDNCPDLTGADIIDLFITRNADQWPTEQDLSNYAISILRLWKVYKLDIAKLTLGKFLDMNCEKLTFDEVLYIASAAKDRNLYYEAIQWYTHALHMTKTEKKKYGDKKARAYKPLAASYDKAKMTWKSIELIKELLEVEPENAGAKRDLKHYESLSQRNNVKELIPPKRRYANLKGKPWAKFDALCRGEIKSVRNQSGLSCTLETKMIPYSPLKAEVRNKDPLIMLYHDVLTPTDLSNLLKSSEVVLKNPVRNGYTEFRKPHPGVDHAHSVWLDDVITRNRIVSHRIEDRLGLSTILRRYDLKNTFQVTNFAPGSSYTPRWIVDEGVYREDIEERPSKVVQTLANVKIFLSDVKGGATVFPYARTRVPVTKGGAVVWIDDQTSDRALKRTLSADCPVLKGVKWGASKWMHPIGIDLTAVPVSSLR